MKELEFREQFTDALAALLVDQQRAGLDIATLGDYFHDEDLGGHSWHRYPLERWDGFAGDFPPSPRLAQELYGAYPDGTKVLCVAMADLKGGKIARQTIVQAWDE